MRVRFTLELALLFAAGGLLMAAVGGATSIFDWGPSEMDVSEARQRGREEATSEIDLGKQEEAETQRQLGFERGLETAEWLSLDLLPNPDSWFAGVLAGRARLEDLAEQAYQSGREQGEIRGRNEAVAAIRREEAAE